jgi:hypothetical protein
VPVHARTGQDRRGASDAPASQVADPLFIRIQGGDLVARLQVFGVTSARVLPLLKRASGL